ncbi:MAG TPA: hypothetical protein VFI69_11250 [Candidatus Limnocylindrales bacterium]|jgi:hypothetical protein|nr:hypothetical protein [Candidatus Limnocylindrales bacterium]
MDAIVVPLSLIVAAVGVAVIGVRLGMLVAPRLERLADRDDEDEDEDAGDRDD